MVRQLKLDTDTKIRQEIMAQSGLFSSLRQAKEAALVCTRCGLCAPRLRRACGRRPAPAADGWLP